MVVLIVPKGMTPDLAMRNIQTHRYMAFVLIPLISH